VALRRLRRRVGFELVHAHNAVPAGDAVRRARLDVPLVVSVHGGDVLYTAPRSEAGREAVARGLGAARLVLANSRGIAELAERYGAGDTRVVHLGTELPRPPETTRGDEGGVGADRGDEAGHIRESGPPTLVTVAHLVGRKRHADVLRALAVLAERHPTLRYAIVGDGPERIPLEGLAARLGLAERVEFCGQLSPAEAMRLTQRIDELLADPQRLREAGLRARATIAQSFTWERCGEQTLKAYEHALRPSPSPQ
jgi:teichuronic acid biosynthesis glycosyltransferase TuaC